MSASTDGPCFFERPFGHWLAVVFTAVCFAAADRIYRGWLWP